MTSNSPPYTCIVLGATSLIGQYLVPVLLENGMRVQALSRNTMSDLAATSTSPLLSWHQISDNLLQTTPVLQSADCLISLAPLWILAPLIPQLSQLGVKRIVAFSSTSRFSKQTSPEPSELAVADQLATAEASVQAACEQAKIDWTILRPTLIYGDIVPDAARAGKALGTILKVIRRFHCFPLVGGAPGLRQPVHAADLAQACLATLQNPQAHNKAYNLSGGEILSYHRMIERIFQVMKKKPCLIPIPLSFLRVALKLAGFLPGYHFLTPEMANRTQQDLCFDHAEAMRDFGYQPRRFLFTPL
jgi:nucleoside-diphosphate-sugar epimerase